ncbi:MAG: hypothetical protein NTX45_22660 [Proteobacteria bacterium]|nr:hypothetical protein [Pseudomonadota bacterium]
MNATHKEHVTFHAVCAIERDYIYIASKPDSLDEEEEFSRLFFYDEQHKSNPWLYHDLPGWSVVSLCVVEKTATSPRQYCALSKQGQLEFDWPSGGKQIEQINGVGLLRQSLPLYGYVNSVRQIAGGLFVCGSGGQIYKKTETGWVHIAPQFKIPAKRQSPGLTTNTIIFHEFSDIDGFSQEDLYVIGMGEIYHYDGHDWTQCPIATDEILNRICCANGKVWICGYNGTLLVGDAKSGFKELSHFTDNMTFSDLGWLDGVIYLASNEGLYFLDKDGLLKEVNTGLNPKLTDANCISVSDGVLWSVGYKDIVFFNGTNWARLEHPDN